VWVVDSTPVECGRSKETVRRSGLAGWAEYGYCASLSRYSWGLRLHLLCTQQGLPISGGHTKAGVITRICQPILARTAAVWHNDRIDQPILRSLTAYDH
jgi:hypothetical protein